VLPFGGLESPPGTVQWPGGPALNTTGLSVLDEQTSVLELGKVALHLASRPAVVGLKLLAYRDRRPGIRRDIADVYTILEAVEAEAVSEERILAEGTERLNSGDVDFSEIGSYLLGREVGRIFSETALDAMGRLLQADETVSDQAIGDVRRSVTGVSRELVEKRLSALRWGLVDR
jgi:predicted nucleotidyltransferase